jgi:Kdo2-lipid IVA lauroyltransferase/acyltransferase
MAASSPWQDLRFRLEYAGLRTIVGLVRLLPLTLAVSWSARLWRILAPRLNRKRHKIALNNLRLAFPDKTASEHEAICVAHWENVGRVVAETVLIDRLLRDPSRIEIPHQGLLSRYRGKLGPAIGVSLHMGNWELAVWPLLVAGANPGAIYRAFDNPYVDRYLSAKRRGLYPGGLFGRKGAGAKPIDDLDLAHRLMDHVRRGGRLGIICDQYYRRGIPVPFFGRMTLAQPIAAILARRTGARIWMARCLRVGTSSRFRVEITELRVPRTANAAADVRSAMQDMHRQFEAWVRDAPAQWMWSYKIWP